MISVRHVRIFCVLAATCGFGCVAAIASPADTDFARTSHEFIEGYLAWRPLTATALGIHRYDGRLTDFGRASVDAERNRLERFDRLVSSIDPGALSVENRYDRLILLTGIRYELFRFRDLGEYTRNPMTYAGALDLNAYAKRNFAPIEERLRSVTSIEREAPALMAAARANLEKVLPKPYVETAIEMAEGASGFLTNELAQAFESAGDPQLKREFASANRRAAEEMASFAAWLRREKLPSADRRYALGRAKFEKMLRETELIGEPSVRLLDLGMKELRLEQKRFADAARQIDSGKKPVDVFREIQRDHPTAENLINDTRRDLDTIRQFVIDHRVVTIPSAVRAIVEETPPYLRATSFASMDTPGPFEKRGTEAFYYVTPVEPGWRPEQKEQWLSAFNYYTTDVVSIHEAYPGHYVQFLWLNASHPSDIARIFDSYAFVEGWAHYCEQMMIDEGYGRGAGSQPSQEAGLRAAKFRLAQSDEALLRLCRLCVAIRTHCDGMSLEDATRFFEQNCYYEHQPAYEEARRGTYDPQYLLYTLGKLQFLKLRSDVRLQEGKQFSLERFHDELLQHGMPPIRLLRERMLKDPKQWDQLF